MGWIKKTWLVTAYYYHENHLPGGIIDDATSGLTSSFEPDLQVDRLSGMIHGGDTEVKPVDSDGQGSVLFQRAPRHIDYVRELGMFDSQAEEMVDRLGRLTELDKRIGEIIKKGERLVILRELDFLLRPDRIS